MATSRGNRNRRAFAPGHTDRAPAAPNTDRAAATGLPDVAALSAAIIAIAVSMFIEKGPWQLLGAVLAVTLGLVIYGYVWGNHRSPRQSLALAAILGVIVMPIGGFAVELHKTHDPWSLIIDGKLTDCLNNQNNSHEYSNNSNTTGKDKLECQSQVNNLPPVITWIAFGMFVFIVDYCRWKKRRRQ